MIVLWGQWFVKTFETPYAFNFLVHNEKEPDFLIRDMKVSYNFCIIHTQDGRLYSIGKSEFGALGVKGITDSNKKGYRIKFPKKEDVLIQSLSVGNKHVLALT
jgi:alpha-tubulin suppressor-like RCC1 family protein